MREAGAAPRTLTATWLVLAAVAAGCVLIGVAMFVARADAQEDGADGNTSSEASETGHESDTTEESEAGHESDTTEESEAGHESEESEESEAGHESEESEESEAGHESEESEESEAGHESETAEGEECDGHHDKDGPHFSGGRRGLRADGERLAEIIGVEVDALHEALRSGKSLADVADDNGVDPQTLIDAITDSIEERTSALLEEGLIDSDKADEMRANADAKAEEIVNRERPADGAGGRHDGDRPGAGRTGSAVAEALT